ncbi:MAG: hypothetical protein ACREMG_10825 [Gemmatimonadales bacterium]
MSTPVGIPLLPLEAGLPAIAKTRDIMPDRALALPARAVVALVLLTLACGGDDTGPSGPTRTYRMGFSAIPPRPDQAILLQNLELWTQRADAAILHLSPPFGELLAGTPAATLVERDQLPLANYYPGKGLVLAVTIDLTNGLDRAAEAPELIALGRSLTEPAVQTVVRAYAVALAQVLNPEWLGLAPETNLIRGTAPPALYAAVLQTANGAAADLGGPGASPRLYLSVQVEVAWGALQGGGGYAGIAQDLVDFPFAEAIGLSSYPYFVYPDPDQIPVEYYARIRDEAQAGAGGGGRVDLGVGREHRLVARGAASLLGAAGRAPVRRQRRPGGATHLRRSRSLDLSSARLSHPSALRVDRAGGRGPGAEAGARALGQPLRPAALGHTRLHHRDAFRRHALPLRDRRPPPVISTPVRDPVNLLAATRHPGGPCSAG